MEDSINGIKAAYRVGMRPIMIPDLIKPTDEIRERMHQIFEALEYVIEYIEGEKKIRRDQLISRSLGILIKK